MAEFAVREALETAEQMIIQLYKKIKCPTTFHDDVEKAQKFLEMIHACLIDSEEFIDEESKLIRNCVNIAHRIHDVLDKFLLLLVTDDVQTNKTFHGTDDEVPVDVQTNRSSDDSDCEVEVPDDFQKDESLESGDDEVAKFIREWEPGKKLSTGVNRIIDENTGFVGKLLDSLQKYISEGRSGFRLGDSLTLSYGELAQGGQVVGFKEHREKLLKQLTEEDSKLSTVLVVGPGGSGKTTLVKNVFESVGGFEVKAWVPVPRGPFQLNELLLKILADCEKKTEKTDPKANVRNFLQEKKYMIVVDDVWRSEDLKCIVKALPNGFHGSRIIITTRNSDVASSLSPKYIHDLSSGLSLEKAKDLLFKKSEGNFPPEFEFAKILRWCGSLPYAISEVGTSLLTTKTQTAGHQLMKFEKDLRSEFRSGSSFSTISSILQPSYTDLPNHLKTCFLYLSAFPDDYCMEPQRLIHLWVAEGFVKPKRGITEEEVAEEYLNELIARSLVLASEKINGQDRSCRVVPHVRDFILSKAENFVTVFEPKSLINHELNSHPTPGEQIRRLSIHQADPIDILRFEELINRYDLTHIRTLLVFTKSGDSSLRYALYSLLYANKYLRVLDVSVVYRGGLEFILRNVDDFSCLGFEHIDVSKFIWKLQFLETLILQSSYFGGFPEIGQPSSLRHLLVSTAREGVKFSAAQIGALSTARKGMKEGAKFYAAQIGALSSIQSLSMIDVDIKGLGELQDLRKLGLVNLETKDGKELCIGLEKMKHLSSLDITAKYRRLLDLDHISSPPLYLQHLCLNGRLKRLPKWISKLTSLQKMELHNSQLYIPTKLLDDLPNLIELHLKRSLRVFPLLFRAHTFKKLMKLSIEFRYLNKMVIEDGALPMLRELNMCRCDRLKSLPKGIGGLESLNKLVVEGMPDEFVAMLQKGSEHRQMVRHIPVILCRKESDQPFEDLSENVSSTSKTQEISVVKQRTW